MERESFEDTNIAKILNENFISIKVDREERPDVDKLYMSFVQVRHLKRTTPITSTENSQKKLT
jgi:uncharacterized protein YyaL (SSP411 family)